MEIEMNKEVPQITFDEGKLVYYVNKKEYHHDFQCSSEELKDLIDSYSKTRKKNVTRIGIILVLTFFTTLLVMTQVDKKNIKQMAGSDYSAIVAIAIFTLIFVSDLIALIKNYFKIKSATKMKDLIIPENNPILEVDYVGVRLYNGSTLMKSINWKEMKFIGIYEKCMLFSSSKRNQMFYISSSYKEKIIKQLKDMEYDFLIADNR